MAAVVSGRQTASGESRGQGVAAEHATNGTHGTYGAAGVHRRPRARPRARARTRTRKFRGVRGYLHSEAPSSGHSETLGEHGFEDDDEDEDDYGGVPPVPPRRTTPAPNTPKHDYRA